MYFYYYIKNISYIISKSYLNSKKIRAKTPSQKLLLLNLRLNAIPINFGMKKILKKKSFFFFGFFGRISCNQRHYSKFCYNKSFK